MKTSSLLPILCFAGLSCLQAVPLVNYNDTWRYRKGTSAPQSDWKTVADASLPVDWLSGVGWIGFGDGSGATAAGTTLSDMQQVSGGAAGYRTFYMRKTFTVPAGLPAADQVVLTVDFDDGFVAFLDGVLVDSFGAPGSVEPTYNYTGTTANHECSFGNSGSNPQAARVTVLGTVGATLTPGTHVLSVMCLNNSLTSSDAVMKVDLATQAPAVPLDYHWTLAESPVTLTATFNVPSGETLTIDPGVEVRCHGGSDAITCAGKIIANGTASQPIRFVRSVPATAWRRIVLTGTQESSFAYCDFDGANTSGTIRGSGTASLSPKVILDHCRFLNTEVQMVDLTYTSCSIKYCEFDSIGAQELLHFSNMPATGYATIQGCRFGLPGTPPTSGYNDIIDFTGGNRPGPIAQFLDNIFLACVDDCFDMDGTDAHIEGNIFINVRKDASRSSSSNPITTGSNGSDLSELVICRNFFYDCEHALMVKDYGTALMQNNTVVNLRANAISNNTNAGGNEGSGIIMFGEPWRGFPYGDGVVFEGNIGAEIENAITDPWPVLAGASAEAGFFFPRSYNCIQRFLQPGTGNMDADPLFVSTTGVDYLNIASKLALQATSPCRGAGPNGLDIGAAVPSGASITGEPPSVTALRTATLQVAGPGVWGYRWRLNGGAWSSEVSLVPAAIWNGGPFTGTMLSAKPPVQLTDLADGTYQVEVQGKNSAGAWQTVPTASKTWIVSNLPTDTDTDGMPDAWETANGLDPNAADDASKDTDGDGMSNLNEFTAGTDPNNRSSALIAEVQQLTPTSVSVAFPTVAGKSYKLQVSTELTGPSWTTLQTYAPAAANGVVTYQDTDFPANGRRFYRVVTPND